MKWKSGMMVLTVLLAVSLSVGCPSGGGNPDPDPPDPQPPLNVEDTSHFRQSVGTQLLAERFVVAGGNFPNTIVMGEGCGTMPTDLRYWFVPAGRVDGQDAPTAFKKAKIKYVTDYGSEFVYEFEVEETQTGGQTQYQVIGNSDILAGVVAAGATAIIVNGITLDIIECWYWGYGWAMWPFGCLPGPGKSLTDGADYVDYETLYSSVDSKSAKVLNVPPSGWIEITPSENLLHIDVEVEYSIYDSTYDRHVDKKWSGRITFDNDGDGHTNAEEQEMGSDPCDPDDPGNGVPTTTVVPNVIGQTLSQANNTLTNVELLVGDISHAFSNTRPAGQVSGQSPVPGQIVPVGSEVDITISLGPEPSNTTIVPSVIGKTLSQATSALAAADLFLGQVSYDYTNTQPAGKIFFQNPASGTSVPLDTEVDVTVSLGPEPIDPLTVQITAPTNNFVGTVGQPINFTGLVTGGVLPYVEFKWHFPDNSFKYQQNVTKTFDIPGTGYVYFDVTDSDGVTVQDRIWVQINSVG